MTIRYHPSFGKMSYIGSTYVYNSLSDLPAQDIMNLKLFNMNGNIVAVALIATGDVEYYSYNENTDSWSIKSSTAVSTPVSLASSIAVNGSVYLTQVTQSGTSLVRFTEDGQMENVAVISDKQIGSMKIFGAENGVNIFSLENIKEGTTSVYNVDFDGSVNLAEGNVININGGMSSDRNPKEACYNSDNGYLSAGIEIDNACRSFVHNSYGHYLFDEKVYSVAGYGSYLFAGTSDSLETIDVTQVNNPVTVGSVPLIYTPWSMVVHQNYLYVSNGNGIAVYDIDGSDLNLVTTFMTYDDGNFLFSYTGPVTDSSGNPVSVNGTLDDTKVLKIFNGKLYAADGHGISVINIDNPANPVYENGVYSSGDVEAMDMSDNRIYIYDRAGLKIYETSSLALFYADYDGIYCDDPTFLHNDDEWYAGCDNGIYSIYLDDPNNPWENDYIYIRDDRVIIEPSFVFSSTAFFPEDNGVRLSTLINDLPESICGNNFKEPGEVCEAGATISCESIDNDYTGGTATCNSSCSGYDTYDCEEDDGWF